MRAIRLRVLLGHPVVPFREDGRYDEFVRIEAALSIRRDGFLRKGFYRESADTAHVEVRYVS